MDAIKTRPGSKTIHTFRSEIYGLRGFNGSLFALTSNGVYRMAKNNRFRKVKSKKILDAINGQN